MSPWSHRRVCPLAVCTAFALAAVVAGCSSSGEADAGPAGSSGGPEAADADVVLTTGADVVATVDERFQSYNIEMVEVTGGQFWQPYDAGSGKVVRPPIDLRSERLRNLAKALGPAYIRVSGSWANSTYFDADGAAGEAPPEGFGGVLTGDQWAGVGDFARAVDGEVVTSFASNDGVRDPAGVWQGDQARALLTFSQEHDVPLAAAELFNEPGLPVGMPTGYDGAAYARDVGTFLRVVDETTPDLRVAGPGATADVVPMVISPAISGEALAEGAKPRLDAFSYHFYPKVSERCGSAEGPEIALTQEYLGRVTETKAYYERLRDEVAPGAPMWITETAQAACGGDRWAATSRDVPRYVDTLGRLSTGDGDVVFHNTLAASDYGLIDEDGLEPRPDYWAAVLWAKLMGPSVLRIDRADTVADLTAYARCQRDDSGVAYAVINASADQSRTVTTRSGSADVYLLTGDLDDASVALNGTDLVAHDDGTLPELDPEKFDGPVKIPPASVAYILDSDAETPACT